MKFIIYGMLIYFLYKLIFQVVVPVSKGVKSVRKNMEQMQKKQAEAVRNAHQAPEEAPVETEYIEFEEVKKK